jgi:uncharacterized protein (DUF2336 family)
VRQIVAETLKDMASAPPEVVQRLARDMEEVVACPVLEFSPLLSDRDLLEIVEEGCASGELCAISRRRGVGERIADAIAATGDNDAVAELLENKSAQIREETLDRLVEAAVEVTAWHEPLVARPHLSMKAVRKLADFVAEHLLGRLEAREDLDRTTARAVAEEVHRRIERREASADCGDLTEKHLRGLHANGQLTDELLTRALNRGDRDTVRFGLALRADCAVALVDHILSAHSAKGVTALSWKADCPMRFANQLQLRMGGIPPAQALTPRNGTDYPLTAEEMEWQLDFFRSLGR